MSDQNELRIAFRLYLKGKRIIFPSGKGVSARGVVEFFYLSGDNDVNKPIFMRFVPYKVDDQLKKNQDDNKKRFLQDLLRSGSLAEAIIESQLICLTPDSATELTGDRVCVFQGVYFLDQFPIDNDLNELPEFRLPLVREFDFKNKGDRYFSEVEILQNGSFGFNLTIATPVEHIWKQTLGADLKFSSRKHLSFSLKYRNCLISNEKFPVNTCYFGHHIFHGDHCTPAENWNPEEFKLGDFGFSKWEISGESSGQQKFPNFQSDDPNDPRWIRNSQLPKIIRHILKDGGCEADVTYIDSCKIKFIEDGSGLSLRFLKLEKGNTISGYTYRVGIKPYGAGHEYDDDCEDNHNVEVENWLRLKREKFSFHVPPGQDDGEWFEFGGKIYFDIEVRFTFPDKSNIFIDEKEITPLVTFKLIPGNSRDFTEKLKGIVDKAIDTMNETRDGLAQIEVEQPQSFFPEMTFTKGGLIWGFVSTCEGKMRSTGGVEWEIDALDNYSTSNLYYFLQTVPGNELLPNEEKAGCGLSYQTNFPQFNTVADTRHYIFCIGSNDSIQFPDKNNNYIVNYALEEPEASFKTFPALEGQLEALHFSRRAGAVFGNNNKQNYLKLTFNPSLELQQLSLNLKLAIDAITPTTVDTPRFMDREKIRQPILIPADSSNSTNNETTKSDSTNAPYYLNVTEKWSQTSDRTMKAVIYDKTEKNQKARNFVVYSKQPFSIYKFSSLPLGSRGDQGTVQVAVYRSETRQWEFKLVSPYYHYVYPPQVIGESADKPRRLELHDFAGTDDPIRPAPDDGTLCRHVVEFRLTPSAELWIRPSDVGRGYFLPEWAGYELFRQAGIYGLGAALEAFRGEFLYGLPVGVNTRKEEGDSRYARVAEIEALTGRIVDEPHQPANPEIQEMIQRWDKLSRVLSRRPERLEIWNNDLDAAIPFAPARFSSGADFALRSTALHRHPIIDDGSSDSYPLPKQSEDENEPGPRYHRQGLSGGALWPIESKNLFEKLLESPESSGGSIEGIALSPLGGDANQSARFLNGIVSIISETRNGFVQRLQVEVLGRIGAFWHRAKHVVVYERTVNIPVQFAPENNGATRTRRPVLRKVSEYIQLMEQERTYPDFSEATSRYTGMLRAKRFNAEIINVDSAWSEDVGDFGWKIPLWNRHSARIRPQVYPKPDMVFVCSAEGTAETSVTAMENLDPDNVFFFSDFKSGTDNTDKWTPRYGVDCINLAPGSLEKEIEKEGTTQNKGRQQQVSRIPMGCRQFTWRVVPSAQKVMVNAHRGSKPVYVDLESVTFMRSYPAESGTRKKDLTKFVVEVQKIEKYASAFGCWREEDASPPNSLGDLDSKRSFGKKYRAFQEAVKSKELDDIDQKKKNIQTQYLAVRKSLDTYGSEAKKIVNHFGKTKNNLNNLLKNAPSRCEKLAQDATGSIRRKQLLIIENIRGWEAHFSPDLLSFPLSKKDLQDYVIEEIVKVLTPVFDQGASDVGNLGNSVEKARAIVQDLEADIEILLRRALARVDECNAAYDRTKPWSENRLNAFADKLAMQSDAVVADINAAVNEMRQRFVSELDGLAQEIGTVVSGAVAGITSSEGKFLGNLEYGYRQFEKTITPVINGLSKVNSTFGKLNETIGKGIDKAKSEKVKEKLRSLKELVQNTQKSTSKKNESLKYLRSEAAKKELTLAKGLQQASDDLKKILTDFQAVTGEMAAILEIASEAGLVNFRQELRNILEKFNVLFTPVLRWMVNGLDKLGDIADGIVLQTKADIQEVIENIGAISSEAFGLIDSVGGDISTTLNDVKKLLSPESFLKEGGLVYDHVLEPCIETILSPLPSLNTYNGDLEELQKNLLVLLKNTSIQIQDELDNLGNAAQDLSDKVSSTCQFLAGRAQQIYKFFENKFEEKVKEEINAVKTNLEQYFDVDGKVKNLTKLVEELQTIDRNVRKIVNDLSSSYESARSYGEHVLHSAGQLTAGGVMSTPNNLLRLYSAATSAPELAALKGNIDRIRCNFDAVSEVIKTTECKALFDELGDSLKALGINMSFDEIGENLLPANMSNLKLSDMFGNFGGINLNDLFSGAKIPASLKDAVVISHDFDKQAMRAWVQVDVNVPLPGRSNLFAVGPFQLDFVESRLWGRVRLEVSKDTDSVQQTGLAVINTNIEAIVAGQNMVSLEKVAIRYSREEGLQVDFNPKYIKLNAAFQFIQDLLGTIFGDEVGGMKLVKYHGIPVGVEHEFNMPPISMMFGTSGVSNIQISNRFKLVAYPDFVIANRFGLSRPDAPFIFSIYVIGGAGYIQVDTEYRPFNGDLSVIVEAAAGGSAMIGFAFGPVKGSVLIVIMIKLQYRKLIGSPGGGLSVSLCLLISGCVDIAGIVHVDICLQLEITYRDNGQIDADGRLSLTIKICRFFKISVDVGVQYKLRGGRSETVVKSNTKIETKGNLQKKIGQLKKARG